MTAERVIDCTDSDTDEAPEEKEKEPLVYPDTASQDEQRRAFLIEFCSSPDVDGKITVQNLALLEAWLKDGVVPEQPKKGKLKEVAGDKT